MSARNSPIIVGPAKGWASNVRPSATTPPKLSTPTSLLQVSPGLYGRSKRAPGRRSAAAASTATLVARAASVPDRRACSSSPRRCFRRVTMPRTGTAAASRRGVAWGLPCSTRAPMSEASWLGQVALGQVTLWRLLWAPGRASGFGCAGQSYRLCFRHRRTTRISSRYGSAPPPHPVRWRRNLTLSLALTLTLSLTRCDGDVGGGGRPGRPRRAPPQAPPAAAGHLRERRRASAGGGGRRGGAQP